ncbi:hypothetical protein ACX0G7_26030 [Flavitalea antarctica]
MIFQEILLDKYCPTLTYKFKISLWCDTLLIETLIISFHGRYRDGSAGSPDAGLIKGVNRTGVAVFRPFSVIVDFTDLEYNWDDDLDLSFEETAPATTLVIVGEKCRSAMSSLQFGLYTDTDIVDHDVFFESLAVALEKLKSQNDRR